MATIDGHHRCSLHIDALVCCATRGEARSLDKDSAKPATFDWEYQVMCSRFGFLSFRERGVWCCYSLWDTHRAYNECLVQLYLIAAGVIKSVVSLLPMEYLSVRNHCLKGGHNILTTWSIDESGTFAHLLSSCNLFSQIFNSLLNP